MTNDFLGECRALDTSSGGDNRPVMNATGNFSGQVWGVVAAGSGHVRLQNAFLGAGRSLDTYSGATNAPFMNTTGNFSGQLWTLTPIGPILHTLPVPQLDPGGGWVDKSEGPTDFGIYLHASGTRRIAMVFVDFSDAPGTQPTAQVADHLLGGGAGPAWYQAESGGRMSLAFTRRDGWMRMPHPSTHYSFRVIDAHRAFFADAAALSKDIDLSTFDVAMVVGAPNDAPGMTVSPAFDQPPGAGARAPTMHGELRLGVGFGKDSYTNRFTNLVHELLHIHGLPDLYTGGGDIFAKVGAWDRMSDIFKGAHLLGWHRHKLGWLDPAREVYLTAPYSTQHTLSPMGSACGTSMIVVPVSVPGHPPKVYVFEIAQSFLGSDNTPSQEGVLAYTVDATLPTLQGPVTILPKNPAPSATHGDLASAPYVAGDTFHDGKVTMRVMDKLGAFYRVQVDIAR